MSMSHPPPAGIRPAIADLPESGIVELVNYGRTKPDLIPLWVGEGDQPTPGWINDAATEALAAGQTFYTWQRGVPPLRQALAEYMSRTFDTPVGEGRIFATVGGMQAILLTLMAIIDPGDEIIMPSPVWPNIFRCLDIVGGVPKQVPLDFKPGIGWTLDVDKFIDGIGPNTKAIFINSPGNPTGWVMSRAEQERIAEVARARGIWIIADEVYHQLHYPGGIAPSFLQVMEPEERLVAINTCSKNWRMTGWRVGWATAPESLGQVYENLIQFTTSGVASFIQYAAAKAIAEGDGMVADMVAECRKGRDLVVQRLGALPKVELAAPSGAFYLFFRVQGEPDSRDLAFRLVDKAQVGLSPGTAFGDGGEEFLRLCFAVSRERLSTAMDRISEVLDGRT